MLKEIINNYKKQSIKVAIRMVYNKYNGSSVYHIYDNNGRICNTKQKY